jgi:O-acetyl-ADP-ribose deacetylase (regulator of RNase III)
MLDHAQNLDPLSRGCSPLCGYDHPVSGEPTLQGQMSLLGESACVRVLDRGDMFSCGAQTLVNPINCHGAMGAGLAAKFAGRYPAMLADYQDRCRRRQVRPGVPYLWHHGTDRVVCFPTKDHWRAPSQLQWVDAGLQTLAMNVVAWNVTSLALPALGCGLGGLPFDDVRALVERYLSPAGVPVLLYAPR